MFRAFTWFSCAALTRAWRRNPLVSARGSMALASRSYRSALARSRSASCWYSSAAAIWSSAVPFVLTLLTKGVGNTSLPAEEHPVMIHPTLMSPIEMTMTYLLTREQLLLLRYRFISHLPSFQHTLYRPPATGRFSLKNRTILVSRGAIGVPSRPPTRDMQWSCQRHRTLTMRNSGIATRYPSRSVRSRTVGTVRH